ncbi:MAG: 30S ribosomal protein S1 [Candidatus Dojkabacteria bacterium]|nr:MAG: 30S ribosomal protein S1 [Candidatus Dojkabacteria bacterium]
MVGQTKSNLYKLIDTSLANTHVKSYQKGSVAEGEILKITPSYIIVKIDGVFDAVVPKSEMETEVKELRVGDKIRVFVVKQEDEYGLMIASQKRTTSAQRWELLEEAYKTDQSVVVNVIEVNSGGLIVGIDGVLGFIPTSLLDPNRVYKLDVDKSAPKDEVQREVTRRLTDLVGTRIKVKIMEIDREKSKIIFSERLALTDQGAEQRQQILKSVKVGDVLEGTVTAVTTYGIFVNANGLDGLVHVSEISWDKVENPADYAVVGDQVKVKLIDISDDGKRVAYSMKQLTEDPWLERSSELKVGNRVKGVITEVEDYGLIVKIGEGITGLVHKSEFSDPKIGDPRDYYKVGDEIDAVILTISPNERKIGLSIKRLQEPKAKYKKSSLKSKKPKVRKPRVSLDITSVLAKANVKSSGEGE